MLGRVYASRLEGNGSVKVGDVMDPGPSTYRPDMLAVQMAQRMRESELQTALVSSSAATSSERPRPRLP